MWISQNENWNSDPSSQSSFDLKHKGLQSIAKTKELSLLFQYIWRGLYIMILNIVISSSIRIWFVSYRPHLLAKVARVTKSGQVYKRWGKHPAESWTPNLLTLRPGIQRWPTCAVQVWMKGGGLNYLSSAQTALAESTSHMQNRKGRGCKRPRSSADAEGQSWIRMCFSWLMCLTE